MGRNRLYGEDSTVYTFRGPKIIDKAIKRLAKKRETNHTRLTYELLMEHPSIINEIKQINNEQRARTRKANPLRPK